MIFPVIFFLISIFFVTLKNFTIVRLMVHHHVAIHDYYYLKQREMRNIIKVIVVIASLSLFVSCDFIGKLKNSNEASKEQTMHNATVDDGELAASIGQLPKSAKDYIDKFMHDKEIARVKAEEEEFDVWFTTGEQMEFDLDGNIKEIECAAGIPESVVDERVLNDVKSIDSEHYVVKIKKKSNGDYEVRLNNGMEIVYDASYNRIG